MASDEAVTEPEPVEDEEDDGVELSVWLSGFGRLVLPTGLLVLGVNYINVTWGRIQVDNLQYPYFVIGVMSLFILWVLVDEVTDLYRKGRERSTVESLREYANEWQSSIFFAGILVIYVVVIPIFGFFSSSFVAMLSMMYASGVRDARIGLLLTLGILGLVWLTFVEFAGVSPPSGMIDSYIR